MAKNGLALLGVAGLLFSSLARADDSVPQGTPASLVPADLSVIAGIDLPQLRAAGPPETVNLLIEGLRPVFAKVGADPGKLGLAVMGISPKVGGAPSATVIVADLPIDRAQLESQMEPPWTAGEYLGTKIRRAKKNAYAILPHDRLIVTEQMKIERVLDVMRGKGPALVDKEAALLLRSIGAPGGRGPAFFAWIKLAALRDSFGKQGTPLDALVEGVVSLTVGGSGADVKMIGRCASKEDAVRTADAARELLDKVAKDGTVAMMGLTPIINAVKVETNAESTHLSLHLSKAQYIDLVTRFAGLAQSSLDSLPKGAPPSSDDTVRPVPKSDSGAKVKPRK